MTPSPGTIPEITPRELKERMERGDPIVLVDVREAFERYIADLPEYGQRRIPVAELLNRVRELDPSDDIVVYCRSGGRSAWAVQHLLALGFERSSNLQGGILRWREDVDPTLRAY